MQTESSLNSANVGVPRTENFNKLLKLQQTKIQTF